MRLIRFLSAGRVHRGRLNDDGTASPLLGAGPDEPYFPERPAFGPERLKVETLLVPLVPVDILAIGLNYRAHAAEGGKETPAVPLLFQKAGNSLNHPGSPIPLPGLSAKVDYEGELAVVIGRAAKDVPRARALEYVFGYTCANDVTARDWQNEKTLGGGQFTRGKSFDGFCPLGPYLVTADEIPDPSLCRIRTLLNGEVMQDQKDERMIFDIPAILESVSSTMTLRPGTVILTGTPSGVGFARTPPVWLKAGDRVRVEISSIGALENPVAAATPGVPWSPGAP